MKKARCPKNKEAQVLHGPTTDNIWTCAECGAEAVFDGKEED